MCCTVTCPCLGDCYAGQKHFTARPTQSTCKLSVPLLLMCAGQERYLNDAVAFYSKSVASESHVSPNPYQFNYENVVPALDLLLAQATGEASYKANVAAFVAKWMDTGSKSGDVYYTTKGLAKASPSGTLQHTANAAFYTLVAAKTVLQGHYMLYACWARNQIGYMLGDAGRSYVTGGWDCHGHFTISSC